MENYQILKKPWVRTCRGVTQDAAQDIPIGDSQPNNVKTWEWTFAFRSSCSVFRASEGFQRGCWFFHVRLPQRLPHKGSIFNLAVTSWDTAVVPFFFSVP